MNNRRTGKIARLPKELRDVVNLMLRDGATYQQVIEKLKDHGHELNAENISNWFEGGFCDWEREQKRIEEMRARSQMALEMVRELKKESGNEGAGVHITEANELILCQPGERDPFGDRRAEAEGNDRGESGELSEARQDRDRAEQ
jgi:hypothetical protein